VKSGEAIRCPAGHHIADPLVWREGGLRCKHRVGNAECNKLVLLLGGFSITEEPVFFLIEVTPEEMQAMRLARMDLDGMRKYLGLDFGEAA
jgi:hypothetical protein